MDKTMDSKSQSGSRRVVSIDTLRGFTMFWITGGGVIATALLGVWDNPAGRAISSQFSHVDWHGFHFWDWIWPLFLFLVGAVIPYSTKKRLNSGQGWITIHYHIIFRTVMLIILGWVLRGLFRFDWESMNWTSVLGRIGICYLGASLLALHLSIRNQIIATVSLLAGYWAVMSFIPVPEHGMAVFDKVGSVAWYVDELVLPAGEQFRFRDGSLVVLATFPAIATTMAGVLAGHWLSGEQAAGKKIRGLVLVGIVSIIVALLWNEIFPINKKLWTSSFVMLTSGMSLVALAILYWIIDIKEYTKWAYFFVVIGANPLTIYFLHGVVRFRYTAEYFFSGIADLSGAFGPAVMAAGIVLIQWALLHFLYRKRIFIKI